MNPAIKLVIIILAGALVNKYVVRRFLPVA